MIKLPLILHQSNATLNFLSFFLFFFSGGTKPETLLHESFFSLYIYIYFSSFRLFISFRSLAFVLSIARTFVMIHIGEMMRNLMLLLRGSLVWKKGKIAICNNFFFFFFSFSLFISRSARVTYLQ